MLNKQSALFKMQYHSEGRVKIHTSYIEQKDKVTTQHEVFYNPVQVFNRDLTLLAMQTHINRLLSNALSFRYIPFDLAINPQKKITILDALSASGLRSIRFLSELSNVDRVYANDISEASSKLIKDNLQLNKLDPSLYTISIEDANVLMRGHTSFDIIDLDPYGSVVPFLDAAMHSLSEGGLLCVTCTDTRVLCGPDISKCYYFYGAVRGAVHDFNQNALRIVLSTISATASRHCKYIVPLIAVQSQFYVRLFVTVFKGKAECALSGLNIGNVYNCNSCGNYQYSSYFSTKTKNSSPNKNKKSLQKQHQPKREKPLQSQRKKQNNVNITSVPNKRICSAVQCEVCGEAYRLNGPIWLGKINQLSFIQEMMIILQKCPNKQMIQKSKQKIQSPYKMELAMYKKIYGILHAIKQQGETSNIPLGFNFDLMCKTIKSTGMSKRILFNIVRKQYIIKESYVSPGIYKSNMPMKYIYDIIKQWKMLSLPDKYLGNLGAGQAFRQIILKKEIEYKVQSFEEGEEKDAKMPAKFIKAGKGMGPKGKPAVKILENVQDDDKK